MNHLHRAAAVFCLAVSSLFSTTALAQGAPDKIVLLSAGPAVSFSPFYMLELLPFAKEEGLDYSVKTTLANTMNLTIAGEGDLAILGLSSALVPARDGKETSIVYALASGLATGFVVGTSKVKSVADCTRMSSSMAGSAVYSATVAYKTMTNANFNILQLGDPAQIIPSVLSGGSDCGISALGVVTPGLDKGLHLVIDPRNAATIPPGTIQDTIGTGLWGMKDNVQKKSAAMIKLMRVIAKMQQYIAKSTPAEMAALLVKHDAYKAFKPEVAAQQIEQERQFWFPNSGYFPQAAWTPTLKYYQYGFPFIDAANKIYSWESRVDMSFWTKVNGQPARK